MIPLRLIKVLTEGKNSCLGTHAEKFPAAGSAPLFPFFLSLGPHHPSSNMQLRNIGLAAILAAVAAANVVVSYTWYVGPAGHPSATSWSPLIDCFSPF